MTLIIIVPKGIGVFVRGKGRTKTADDLNLKNRSPTDWKYIPESKTKLHVY